MRAWGSRAYLFSLIPARQLIGLEQAIHMLLRSRMEGQTNYEREQVWARRRGNFVGAQSGVWVLGMTAGYIKPPIATQHNSNTT